MAAPAHHITEPVLSDAASRMNDHAIADQRMRERASRADRAVPPDAHGGPDDGADLEDGPRPDLGPRPDDGGGSDGHSLLEPRRGMHVGARGPAARFEQRGGTERARVERAGGL